MIEEGDPPLIVLIILIGIVFAPLGVVYPDQVELLMGCLALLSLAGLWCCAFYHLIIFIAKRIIK